MFSFQKGGCWKIRRFTNKNIASDHTSTLTCCAMETIYKTVQLGRPWWKKLKDAFYFEEVWRHFHHNYKALSILAILIQNCICSMALVFLILGPWLMLLQLSLLVVVFTACMTFNFGTLLEYCS